MENLKLLRKDNVFYVEYGEMRFPIEEWEAREILADHDKVYEVVIRHKRKFNFNTTEDTIM